MSKVAEHQANPTKNDKPCIQDLVMADIDARKQVGIERYGTVLQPFNGRSALLDAYQEALDLCQYLRQLVYEQEHDENGERVTSETGRDPEADSSIGKTNRRTRPPKYWFSGARGQMTHQQYSFFKSIVRIVGYGFLWQFTPMGSCILIASEIIGIAEEIGHE